MTILPSSMRRHFTVFCCLFAVFACAGVMRADDVPTFGDPEVTKFAQDYNAFIDQYVVVMKDYMAAVKAGDTAKMQAITGKMQDFQTKAQDLQTRGSALQGKIKPDEAKRFSDYMQASVTKMTDALK